MNWINIQDRLPDLDIEVIVSDGKYIRIGFLTFDHFFGNNIFVESNKCTILFGIKYWMSFPKLPGEL